MILIDDRVGSKELYPHIPSAIPHQLTRLDFGDACWMGNGPNGVNTQWIGVERKRLSDMLSSMRSGRLANHQLPGMAAAYHHSYVVVEGIWRDGDNGLIEVYKGRGRGWEPLALGSERFTVSSMDNFANTLTCMLNATVVYTRSLERTGRWMCNIYRWWTSKKWEQHRSCRGKVCHPLPVVGCGKAPLVARMVMEMRGVGVDRAMKIAKVFPTMADLCVASVDQIMTVPGVGRTTAQGVWEQIRKG
jgi:ERCC4-type nuclease